MDDPKLFRHPMLLRPNWPEHAVPYTVFGDAGKFTNVASLYILTWSLLLAEGDQWLTTLLATAVPSACCAKQRDHGADTITELWDIVSKDLTAAFYGEFGGSTDPDGDFLVCFGVCGDQDHHVNHLGLNHWASANPCWLCQANRTDKNWRDVSLTAAYRATFLGQPCSQKFMHVYRSLVALCSSRLFSSRASDYHRCLQVSAAFKLC
jgi:hypothetical protein